MISTKDLSYSYSGSTQLHFPDWTIRQTEPALLLGRSGSGKTTLLHLMGGLLKPGMGSVNIAGTDLVSVPLSLPALRSPDFPLSVYHLERPNSGTLFI